MVLALADCGPECHRSVRELGEAQDVPYPFARAIATDLVGVGILASRRGPAGGVRLARPAGDITLREVIEAVEGPVGLNLCTTDPDYCARTEGCFMHQVWREAADTLNDFLERQTFADLAGRRIVHTGDRQTA